MQVITKVHQGQAFENYYYNEDKGFVTVAKCDDCDLMGYHLDLSNYNPCPSCGGTIRDLSEPAKQVNGKWQVRTGFRKEDEPEVPEFYSESVNDTDEEKTDKKKGWF